MKRGYSKDKAQSQKEKGIQYRERSRGHRAEERGEKGNAEYRILNFEC
jgi:hypothetical protein